MTRALGLDLGSVRIGVATSDPGRVIASPYDVIRRGNDHAADHAAIAAAVDDSQATVVVVGLPRNMRGQETAAAQAVRAEAEELRAALAVPVVFWDERLSTVTAQRSLIEGGVRRKQRKDSVDKVAAAVILQSWLDAGCPTDRG
ncbi:MAG TPA: Holliday junction resolvase RuvX [Acidimicrobiales bacterium]|nr:Holliday junction resolvase RuvX [Acidimicrobiales bacterium]